MSGCNVDVDVDTWDCEPMQFDHCTTPTARKEHKCYECGGKIMPGERYERFVGKDDDGFSVVKTCTACRDIRSVLMPYGYIYGCIWDDIREQAFPEFERVGIYECAAALETKEARDKLTGAFDEWHALRAEQTSKGES